ncbi:hypothetical protein CBM2634_A40063 [Cupriavidus taiwanensis]|uniref:Uncharacterized protein n=1 Tax=Cupriavidus taiwanensis TaxID=164546 RepID=A0A375J2A0_9BURK|nr:hypothetical protein CBM2634_A40063 [Cupriavidus taiwanensis]
MLPRSGFLNVFYFTPKCISFPRDFVYLSFAFRTEMFLAYLQDLILIPFGRFVIAALQYKPTPRSA